ncbi:hypothetical protein UA08_03269 [Talaromyces atroroseus]|uniref:Asl1-like glycosyl hydrolase catalytic domain-containing protein n=1 Tax=Talaromyces atroroseus TaxID=1441469 RepID=A0A225B2G7_TALAT|nr:hypothetical protein UA08_03269 [Talaromyces atroroseus]OKL61446.1 hypothetical protein UA08_03269 [Talaromyces atroroseus]
MASVLKFAAAGLLVASAGAVPSKQLRSSSLQKRSSSGKAGAAYNDASLVSALIGDSSDISWAYNWGCGSYADLPSGVEYVPMLWGASSTYLDAWTSEIESAISDGSTYIMGFNEPDMSSQADLSASEAASYYKEYITPYAGKATLVSPAVTSSSSSGEGLDWFESFISDCSDCSVSVLAVHWYGTSVSELQAFITEAIDTASNYGISEVWLTEFALSSDEGGISDLSTATSFVEEAGTWLNEQSALTRYSYFYVANGYLLTDGVANSVGDAYNSAASSSSSSSSSSVSSSSTTSTSTSTSVYVAPSTTTSSSTESTSTSSSTSIYVAPPTTTASTSTSTSIYVAPTTTTAASGSETFNTNNDSTSESSAEAYDAPQATTTSVATSTTPSTSITTVTITQKVTVTAPCVPTPPPCQLSSSVPTPSWSSSGFITRTAVVPTSTSAL